MVVALPGLFLALSAPLFGFVADGGDGADDGGGVDADPVQDERQFDDQGEEVQSAEQRD
ncbi:hypothetical protein ABTX60_07495 [Streptomyces sp. NPDC126510]|uniref:hypothetical protein n=1 Tax=Streptomyces sp. NPDC126510 TaxID=3155317 RepID=UPI00332CBDF5